MQASPRRLLIVGLALAALVAATGGVWEVARFGASPATASDRLAADVHRTFATQAARLEALTQAVADRAPEVARAVQSREAVQPLFADLDHLTSGASPATSLTVYVPTGAPGTYRVIAWSDGPVEDIPSERLNGGPALFVTQSALGLPLIHLRPVQIDGRRAAVVVAACILAPPAPGAGAMTAVYARDTPYGPVMFTHPFGAESGGSAAATLVLNDANGTPVVEARYETADLAAARYRFRARALAAAAVPLVVTLLLLSGAVLDRRTAANSGFWRWSLLAAAMLGAAALTLGWLLRAIGIALTPVLTLDLAGLAALGFMALLPLSWWRRRHRRRRPADAPLRYVADQIAVGACGGVALLLLTRFLARTIDADALTEWQFPLFATRVDGMLYLAGLLLVEAAGFWTIATLWATVAERWRLGRRHPAVAATTLTLWALAAAAVLGAAWSRGVAVPWLPIGAAAAAAAAFALAGTVVRRRYRHTTEAMRLTLLLAALLLPSIVLYPTASSYADRTARALVTDEYTPATQDYPRRLLQAVYQTEEDVDRFPALQDLVAAPHGGGAAIPPQAAFGVWSRTALAEERLSSSVELYGPTGTLVSRFALNVPEYLAVKVAQTWQGHSCQWVVFWEATGFGAEERVMLHAERGLCDATGTPRGAVVLHVMPDYRSLAFVSQEDPYYDVLHTPAVPARGARITDLQVVVYGWSLTPIFASGTVAWPIAPPLFQRLYASRTPFWATLDADNRAYSVYFANDQSGIYALGYPEPTVFEHLTRLAETASVVGGLFVLLLLGATVYEPLARHRPAPIRLLAEEVRTSFYRKLFLYLVLAAVGPIVVVAVALGGSLAAKFRADVASQAASLVTVARRVLEESLALQQQPGAGAAPVSDDVLVLIGQVINQDVNFFDGPELVATSQRDLFESGLLPTRTPASVYRGIALERLPNYVGEDQIGGFQYLLVAAPVPPRGPDAILSVPLALRQREIEREIDDLNRGVLAGGVFVVLLVAGLGVYIAGRISTPVSRLSRAARQIAAGRLDVQIVADTADELQRLVDDFNSMAATLRAQRAELARTNQLKAWAEMARQVAHEIKNPLTPIQLAAEHLQRVHGDRGRPLGEVFDRCVDTILGQVRLLRRIASEFSTFAATPTPHLADVAPAEVVHEVLEPYRRTVGPHVRLVAEMPGPLPAVHVDRMLLARALTNLVENALQAMPEGGTLRVAAAAAPGGGHVELTFSDTGVGMDEAALARAFEPYFSTKTGGSGLGLPNAKRNVELCGGTLAVASTVGRGTTVTVVLPASSGGPADR